MEKEGACCGAIQVQLSRKEHRHIVPQSTQETARRQEQHADTVSTESRVARNRLHGIHLVGRDVLTKKRETRNTAGRGRRREVRRGTVRAELTGTKNMWNSFAF